MTNLCDCGRPVQDAYACGACAGQLEDALRQVPELAAELEITRLRMARVGSPGSGGGADRLPWDPRAAEAADVLRSALVGWVRVADEASGAHGAAEGFPPDRMAAMSAWLLRRVELIRHTEVASECVDEITAAVRNARRAIDRPAAMRYAGPCDECGTDLLAKPDAPRVYCRECGVSYDVADRQMWMRAQLEDHLGNASYVAAIATALGVTISAKTIRTWMDRKKLQPAHYQPAKIEGGRPRPIFRVGDVVRVAAGLSQYEPDVISAG